MLTATDKKVLLAVALLALGGFFCMPHLWLAAAIVGAIWLVLFFLREPPQTPNPA